MLFKQFQQIITNSTDEDLTILTKWMDGFEKKNFGEISTFLSAGFHREWTLIDDSCMVSLPIIPVNSQQFKHLLATRSLPKDRAAVTMNLSIT